MTTQNVTVAVAGATYGAMNDIADFAGVVKKAVSDGWTPGTDIPTVLLAAVHDFGKVFSNVQAIQAETAGDRAQLAQALVLGGAAIVAAVTG